MEHKPTHIGPSCEKAGKCRHESCWTIWLEQFVEWAARKYAV